jgi:RNA processing factor Prp31
MNMLRTLAKKFSIKASIDCHKGNIEQISFMTNPEKYVENLLRKSSQ